jgi:hypothetical protein
MLTPCRSEVPSQVRYSAGPRTIRGMSVRAEGCAFSPLAAIGSHAWRASIGGMPPIYAMREEGHAMTQYLITFPSDAMNHIPDEEMPERNSQDLWIGVSRDLLITS